MRTNRKRVFIALVISACVATAFSQDLTVRYNKNFQPGDAIVITVTLDNESPKDFTATASLHLENSSKTLVKADMYKIATNNYSVIIPMSAWYGKDTFYISLLCKFSNDKVKQIDLPLTYVTKDFNEDFIWLDKKNTAIKTDTSPTKQTQVDTFWELINTTTTDAMYHCNTFTHPLETIYNTGYFGDKRTYKYTGTNETGSTSMHYGTDYRASVGTPLFASATGKVVMAQERISSGLSIIIEHLPGFYSLYYHLDEIAVKVGQIVEQGEIIGKTGNTGLTTGPHLHWEVRILGVPVDPEFFLTQPLSMYCLD